MNKTVYILETHPIALKFIHNAKGIIGLSVRIKLIDLASINGALMNFDKQNAPFFITFYLWYQVYSLFLLYLSVYRISSSQNYYLLISLLITFVIFLT